MCAAEKHYELLEYLIRNTNFNFELTDRWGFRPLDEIRDLKQRAHYFDEIKNRKPICRRGSLPIEVLNKHSLPESNRNSHQVPVRSQIVEELNETEEDTGHNSSLEKK